MSGRGGRKGPAAPRETAPGTFVPARTGSRPAWGRSLRVDSAPGLRAWPGAQQRFAAAATTLPCGPSRVKYKLRALWKRGAKHPQSCYAPRQLCLSPSHCTAGVVLLLQQLLGFSLGKTQHLLPSPGHGQGWLELNNHRLEPAPYNERLQSEHKVKNRDLITTTFK